MDVSISGAITDGTVILRQAGIADARREAGSLMAHATRRDRTFIVTHTDYSLTPETLAQFFELLKRRANGEPLAYITGHREFFKLDFEVGPGVLIPRPETELIVEIALEILDGSSAVDIADICTGSGCIAISLLAELPHARAIATDISAPALDTVRKNAARHDVTNRLTLIQSDCFSGMRSDNAFALICSNPPYISDDEMKEVPREVRYEPLAALAGGPDGLTVIRRLLDEAVPFLVSGGYFVFEIGFRQSDSIEQLVDRKVWKLVEIRKDLQQIPRTVVLQKK